jgi:hypothetical protein
MASGEWRMGKPVPIHSFKDLEVWQMAMTLAADCYHLTARFPKEEICSMTAQIRRGISAREHCGGARSREHWIVYSVSEDRPRLAEGAGNPFAPC